METGEERIDGFVNRLYFSALMLSEVLPALESWQNILACGVPISKFEAYGGFSEEKLDKRLASFFEKAASLSGVETYDC